MVFRWYRNYNANKLNYSRKGRDLDIRIFKASMGAGYVCDDDNDDESEDVEEEAAATETATAATMDRISFIT